jgi:hypothetical protein
MLLDQDDRAGQLSGRHLILEKSVRIFSLSGLGAGTSFALAIFSPIAQQATHAAVQGEAPGRRGNDRMQPVTHDRGE